MRRFLLIDATVIVTQTSLFGWFGTRLAGNHNQTRLGRGGTR